MQKRIPHSPAWEKAITELEAFFKGRVLPGSIPALHITNTVLFVEAHLRVVRENHSNPTFLPYAQRLREIQQLLLTHDKHNHNGGDNMEAETD